MRVHRLALFIGELGWADVTKLCKDQRTVSVAGQLFRALGSISANIAEGYARGSGRAWTQFYQYAPGSACESRDWFYRSRYILGEDVFAHRAKILGEFSRLLLTMIPAQRKATTREYTAMYTTTHNNHETRDSTLPVPNLDQDE